MLPKSLKSALSVVRPAATNRIISATSRLWLETHAFVSL
jgi:hypothetical protein